jgi:ParB/RepB/Spo0J family partition protein
MASETRVIPIASVQVSTRIRKDPGDLTELADDLRKHGLINPITVMDCQNGRYPLIAGLRRLEAAKLIQMSELRATLLSPMQAEELLEIEIAENEQRLNFTTAERLEYAEKIKAIEQAKARERQLAPLRKGSESANSPVVRICAQRGNGKSREAIAQRVGFTSSRQMERAGIVAEKLPELLPKIDSGEITISGAYKTAYKTDSKAKDLQTGFISDTPKASNDQVARAGLIRLMKNPHFIELRKELETLQSEATSAKTKLKWATEAYDNKVKHFENNIDFLSRRVRELEQENAELRARLGMEERHEKRVEFGNPDGIIRIPEDTLS